LGRSVLCEATTALSRTHLAELAYLGERQNAVLRFVESYRWSAGHALLKRLLRGREPLWRPLYVRVGRTAGPARHRLDWLALQELASYDSLFNSRPLRVSAMRLAGNTAGLGAVSMTVKYDDAPRLHCLLSVAEAKEEHALFVVGAERTLSLDHVKTRLEMTDGSGVSRQHAFPCRGHLDALAADVHRFLDAVAAEDASGGNADRWLRAAAIWAAASRSLRLGATVEVSQSLETPPPRLTMIEGGGRSTGVRPKPELTLVAG